MLCGLEHHLCLGDLHSSTPSPCPQVDANGAACAPRSLGGEAESPSLWGLGWEELPFRAPRALAASPLPSLSFSRKKVRSRMGPEVGHFPNVSAICGTLQLNVIISVVGSECQRTVRDGVTNSRLTVGLWLPLPWAITQGGEETGPLVGSAGRTTGLSGDVHRASERRCVFVCVHGDTCAHGSASVCLSIVIVCQPHVLRYPWEDVRSEQPVICACLCLRVLHLKLSLSVRLCVHTHDQNSGSDVAHIHTN